MSMLRPGAFQLAPLLYFPRGFSSAARSSEGDGGPPPALLLPLPPSVLVGDATPLWRLVSIESMPDELVRARERPALRESAGDASVVGEGGAPFAMLADASVLSPAAAAAPDAAGKVAPASSAGDEVSILSGGVAASAGMVGGRGRGVQTER